MIQKIYKNTDLLFSIEIGDNNNIIDIADIGELTIVFYTDTTSIENHIIITKDDIINSNQIFLDNSKLDLLNEGLLKYNIKLRFNNTSIDEPFDIAKDDETEYFIKNNNFNDGSSCTGGTTDSYSKSEIDLKLSLKANSSDVYSKAEINERLAEKANKTDLPDISNLATKNELNLKANSSDVYSKVEVDEKIADAGTGTGGTVTSSEVYILRWDEIQATEERAALYTKLYESFWYNNTVSVLFNVINGTDEYIIDVNNIYKDNSATRNEIKMYGSCILSSSIFHVEIVLKKDGSFTFTKNNIAINKLNTMQLEERIETLESEIKNPTEMKVDCLNYE